MPMNSTDFYKQALEAANTGVWEWNIKSNELAWTDRVRKIFDVPDDLPITMQSFSDCMHPNDREFVHQEIQKAMSPDYRNDYHINHRIIDRSGKTRWVEGFGKVYRDEQGNPSVFCGTVKDITASKLLEIERAQLLDREQKAKKAIELEKEKIEQLFLKSPVPIAVIQGPNFNFLLANDPYLKMVGMDRDIRGLSVKDLFPNPDPKAYQNLIDTFTTGKQFIAHEQHIVMDWYRTGQVIEKYFDTIYEQVPGDSPETTLLIIMAVDVTDQVVFRKKTEANSKELQQAKRAAEEASISKSRFLANMSHEIRTPLGIIMGFTDLALENVGAETVKNYLLGIQRNGHLLNRIVGEILDLSKIEASRLELEIVSFQLKDMLEETIASLQLGALEKNITLSLTLDPSLPDVVETDPTRLRQIVINLIGNAIKFTDRGQVTATAKWNNKDLLQLEVEDTGIGITADQQQKLFQPFSQADTSMTRRFGGTGLGLILAKELSQALGGDLILSQSIIGTGSLFTCTVKPRSANWNAKAQTQLKKSQPQLSLKNTKILVIDDSEDNRFLITQILQSTGALTDEAENGFVGLAMAMQNSYDIILMDLQMPVMDGRQATVNMRKQGIKTPIIALTAHALKEEKQKALQEGFTEYLTKPINRDLLISTIDHLKN